MELVGKVLQVKNISTVWIHSGLSTEERAIRLELFRNTTTIAVTTDLFARSIDIPSLKVVMNYDLPLNVYTDRADTKAYLYRVGRTSRFGEIYFIFFQLHIVNNFPFFMS